MKWPRDPSGIRPLPVGPRLKSPLIQPESAKCSTISSTNGLLTYINEGPPVSMLTPDSRVPK